MDSNSESLSVKGDTLLEDYGESDRNLFDLDGCYLECVDLSGDENILDVEENGLPSLHEALECRKIESNRDLDVFLCAVAEDRWANAINLRSEIIRIKEKDRNQLVRQFYEFARMHFKDLNTLIRASYLSDLSTGAVRQIGFLRGEIANRWNHRPIHTLIRKTAGILQRINTVLLMIPTSIGSLFLPIR